MEVKTYGIYGLTEWYGKVKAGTIEAKLSFVGGTCSPGGVQPAYLVTKDPIKQFVIENSKEFRNGFIRLIMRQEVPGTHKRIATHKAKPKICNETVANGTAEEATTGVETATPNADIESIEDTQPSTEEVVGENTAEEKSAEGLTEVEFTDNQEAKDYIFKNFGVKPGTMRNREDIKAVGETYGVKITFVNEK